MAKSARIASFIIPFVLSIAALVCFSLLAAAGPNNTLTSLRFVRVGLTPASSANSTGPSGNHQSIYDIFLFGYCSEENGTTTCSSHQTTYTFDPLKVLGPIFNSSLSNASSTSFNDHYNDYHMAAASSGVVFYISFALVCLELLVAGPALFWHWGVVLGLLLGCLAAFIAILWAILTTLMFAALQTAFKITSSSYHISTQFGAAALVLTWLAPVFLIGSAIAIAVFSCCGRLGYHDAVKESAGWEEMDDDSDVSDQSVEKELTDAEMRRARRHEKRDALRSLDYIPYSVPFYF